MTFEWFDPGLSLGGLLAGLMVGLTGMGGAALVTPMLVLLFNVPAAAAVSSDVVASAVMKPVGAVVHARHGTVHWGLVWWLSAGSIPGVLLGTWVFARVLSGAEAEETIRTWIGVVLLIALAAMLARTFITARAKRIAGPQALVGPEAPVKVVPTVVLGLVVGTLVGMTSVGSGSLVVTTLLLLYPLLRPSVLVGTDLTQAVPMLLAGALAHMGLGDIAWGVTLSLLVGQIPGVWMGARLSSRYDGHALRWLLMVVLGATALKLLGAPAAVAGGAALLGVVVIGAIMLREHLLHRRIADPVDLDDPVELEAELDAEPDAEPDAELDAELEAAADGARPAPGEHAGPGGRVTRSR